MAFLGTIVKTLLEAKHELLPQEPGNPASAQTDQLVTLLQTARDTAFGKHFDFQGMLDSGMPYTLFAQRVPIYDYHRMHADWWKRQQTEENITWPGMPPYFALSSGTTGKKSKRIPVTEDMLSSIQSVGRSQAECLANFDLPADLFEKDVLMLSSSAELAEKDGHLEGEISGINVSNMPEFFQGYYKPGIEIAKIPDWEDRVNAIAEAAPEWDVAAIAGIPSWVQMMLRRVMERHKLKTIHEIWPNLAVYTTGGVAFAPYAESFNAILERPIIVMDTYLASEGFFAFTARPGTMSMQLALDHGIFYEFIPFDGRGFTPEGELLENPQTLPFALVEKDQDYALVISSPAGSWRYMIGDTVRFTDLEKMELVISGRTKYFLNVVGSQLSEEKLNAAIGELNEEYSDTGLTVKEFGVAAIRRDEDQEYVHQWVLGTEGDTSVDEGKVAEFLDANLRGANKNYNVARTKALKEIRVKTVPADRLYAWLETTKKKGGQIKMPKVMGEEKMRELLGFLEG
ncbi:MAG: GH3 auxin-responsive promoter family protein [Saprospiraceae bacterium]